MDSEKRLGLARTQTKAVGAIRRHGGKGGGEGRARAGGGTRAPLEGLGERLGK
jgi:hypothetical protein